MRGKYWVQVSRDGTLTLPKEVFDLLNLDRLAKVAFLVEDGVVTLGFPVETWKDVGGSIRPLDPSLSWDEIERIAKEEVAERYLKKFPPSTT